MILIFLKVLRVERELKIRPIAMSLYGNNILNETFLQD